MREKAPLAAIGTTSRKAVAAHQPAASCVLSLPHNLHAIASARIAQEEQDRAARLAKLHELLDKVAAYLLLDPVYEPIFLRLEAEIAALEKPEVTSPLARAMQRLKVAG